MDYLPGTVARHTQTKNLLTEKFFILTPQKKNSFSNKKHFSNPPERTNFLSEGEKNIYGKKLKHFILDMFLTWLC